MRREHRDSPLRKTYTLATRGPGCLRLCAHGLDDRVVVVEPEGHVLRRGALYVPDGEVGDCDCTVGGEDRPRPHLAACRALLLGGLVCVTHRSGTPMAA